VSKFEKALQRLKTIPKDFTYDEMKALLEHLGFEEYSKGKTSGSAVSFIRKSDNRVFMFHKPHPGNIVKTVYIKQLLEFLRECGEIE
jgi:hypothetical protein